MKPSARAPGPGTGDRVAPRFSEQELSDSPLYTDSGELNDRNWGDFTLRLEQGRVRLTQRNRRAHLELSGRYATDGDSIELQFDDSEKRSRSVGR